MTRSIRPVLVVILLALALLVTGALAAGTERSSDVLAYVVWDTQTTTSRVELMDIDHRLAIPRYTVFGRVDDLNWTPDGNRLVFAAFRPDELRRDVIVLEVASGDWYWLTNGPADHNTPDITRDGAQMVIQRHDRAGDSWNLAFIDPQTGIFERTLLETRFRNEGRPDASPDGRRVAYQASGIVNTPLVGVVDTLSGEILWEAAGIEPAWSPDGALLAYIGATTGLSDILLVDIRDGSVRELSIDNILERTPDWSPDGERLVFTATPGGGIVSDMYIVRIDGSGLRPLTQQDAIYQAPVWRPR